jgi:hypothetical protein
LTVVILAPKLSLQLDLKGALNSLIAGIAMAVAVLAARIQLHNRFLPPFYSLFKLDLERADFLIAGPRYSHICRGAALASTGTPGEYRASIVLPSDIPLGTYKLYCVRCTISDGLGSFAPTPTPIQVQMKR